MNTGLVYGRIGRHPPAVYGEIVYNAETCVYTIKMDCENNPEFSMSFSILEKDLNDAKTMSSGVYGGITFGKREEENEKIEDE